VSLPVATGVRRSDGETMPSFCCWLALGLRASEVASLNLDDIDWAAGTFSVAEREGSRASFLYPKMSARP